MVFVVGIFLPSWQLLGLKEIDVSGSVVVSREHLHFSVFFLLSVLSLNLGRTHISPPTM